MWWGLRNPGVSKNKKFPLYGPVCFLHVSLSIPENRTRKYSGLTSLQHFEVDIRRKFQKWKFWLFPIFSKFCFQKIPFYDIMGFLIYFSVDARKPRSKIPKIQLFTAFWSWHSQKFSKMKLLVFLQIFLPTYGWVPQIALRRINFNKIGSFHGKRYNFVDFVIFLYSRLKWKELFSPVF